MARRRKKGFNIPQKYIPYLIVAILVLGIISLITNKMSDGNKQPVQTVYEAPEGFGVVHFIDAGQGDCILIRSPQGKFALIDASTNDSSRAVLSYLEDAGVEKLEFVLFTHPHEDHIGGGDEVLNKYKADTVYTNGLVNTSSNYKRLLNAIKDNGAKHVIPSAKDVFGFDGIEFLVLSDGKKYKDSDNYNNTSICLKMTFGDVDFILTGDAESAVEYDILKGGFDIDAEVFKAAHHGSTTSNTPIFLDEINPDICVVSCGKNNDYGHPHDEIVAYLDDNNIQLLRTDLDGNVQIAYDEKRILILE